MLHRTPAFGRSAVAFFNMKTFHGRYKTSLEPSTLREVFSTQVMPTDRLLQQSRAGAGAARVLLINHRQMVKGVYSPLLCMPHPTLVASGDSPLGVTVEQYLSALGTVAAGASSSSKRMGANRAPVPTVMVTVSHPNGLAVGSFTADGSPQFQVRNISFEPLSPSSSNAAATAATAGSESSGGLGAASREVMAPLQVPDAVLDEFVDTVNALYEPYLASCSTLYFVTHDRASVTLDALRAALKAREEVGTAPTVRLPLDDRRWVPMPELALQGGHPTAALYARDATTRTKIVNPAGLTAAVCRGQLELDYVPQDPNELKAASSKPRGGAYTKPSTRASS